MRGTGNLLGAAQHGHIAAVGFDLYTKLLSEAVRELQGAPAPVEVEPVISADVEALLPETYVPEVNQRLALYKRLAEVRGAEEVEQIRAELADRFGPLPSAVEALVEVLALRVAARDLGVERIEARRGRAVLTFSPSTRVSPERILAAISRSRGAMALKKEYTLEVRIPESPWAAVRDALTAVLRSLA
jgi:transcription-repair coupling factor (superfamily II helicase)